ncbi:ABC transporter ATP-binding protein [Candidatus Bathyarchaeota archaeon]|nr:ABC transporter ATP-binding protein [Candidatus Bathyarchaeota archaeon]
MSAVLQVENLTTFYTTLRGPVRAAENVTFNVGKGEALGLVGESGCGKTTVALSILKLLPSNGKIVRGKILFEGKDIVKIKDKEFRQEIRWKGISIVFQGAMNALNPVFKVGDQVSEAIKIHEPRMKKEEINERVAKLFELVGLDPGRADNYPHEFSGGMRQRALIAMSLACNPALLISDEPCTALDVIVASQVLKLLREIKEKLNLGMILISHDLSIVAETCEKMGIMYAGMLAEYGNVMDTFKKPLHPYTQGLISAFPSIKGERTRMVSIPGIPPDLLNPPTGCRFHPRCKYAMDICIKKEPSWWNVEKGRYVRCWLYEKG